jgi:hypothetical protein
MEDGEIRSYPTYFTAILADADKNGVPQVSKPAVSPISKSAGPQKGEASAGLETRETADLEVCATSLPVQLPIKVFAACANSSRPRPRLFRFSIARTRTTTMTIWLQHQPRREISGSESNRCGVPVSVRPA